MTLSNYLNGFAPVEGTLHLMHSTPVGVGAQILVEGGLHMLRCAVYDQDFVYLFYGWPAFKPLPGTAPGAVDEHLPMCLVIDPALLGGVIRIVPFDSGYARYAHHTGPLLTRPDFELGPGRETPMRLVKAFYGTGHNYYRQIPTADPAEIPFSQAAARAYARLSRDTALADDDDRRSTIEVQIARSIRKGWGELRPGARSKPGLGEAALDEADGRGREVGSAVALSVVAAPPGSGIRRYPTSPAFMPDERLPTASTAVTAVARRGGSSGVVAP